jgi:hypothetical protein
LYPCRSRIGRSLWGIWRIMRKLARWRENNL